MATRNKTCPLICTHKCGKHTRSRICSREQILVIVQIRGVRRCREHGRRLAVISGKPHTATNLVLIHPRTPTGCIDHLAVTIRTGSAPFCHECGGTRGFITLIAVMISCCIKMQGISNIFIGIVESLPFLLIWLGRIEICSDNHQIIVASISNCLGNLCCILVDSAGIITNRFVVNFPDNVGNILVFRGHFLKEVCRFRDFTTRIMRMPVHDDVNIILNSLIYNQFDKRFLTRLISSSGSSLILRQITIAGHTRISICY